MYRKRYEVSVAVLPAPLLRRCRRSAIGWVGAAPKPSTVGGIIRRVEGLCDRRSPPAVKAFNTPRRGVSSKRAS